MVTINNTEALIEQFDSLQMVTNEKILVLEKHRRVAIEGRQLTIKVFTKDEILIGGKITKVIFDEI